jgi:hypothetical protein
MKQPIASAKPKDPQVIVRWDWTLHHSHTEQTFLYYRLKKRTFLDFNEVGIELNKLANNKLRKRSIRGMTFKNFMHTVAKITLYKVKEVCGTKTH